MQVRVQDCSFDELISASSRKQRGGFFDEIIVENSVGGKATFYGNKVLLMRNLYFRNLILKQEDRPLPPENVLQILASSVVAAPKIDWHIESFHPLNEPLSFVRQEIFVFIQEALKEQGDKRESLLAQLAQFVAPMEFPRLWLDHFIKYFNKHKIDKLEALTQLLNHFGHFISCCILLEVCTLFKLREKTLKELIELEMDLSHLKSTTDRLTSSYENYENNDGWKCSDQTLLLLLARSPLLRILHLTFNYPLKEETILTLIDRHPELIDIELSFINSMSDQILKRLGEKSKKLVSFGCCKDKLSFEAFENMISNLPLLKDVHANFTDEERKNLKAKYPSVKFQ